MRVTRYSKMPLSQAFTELRDRYVTLMSNEISEPMECEVWLSLLQAILLDANSVGIKVSELCHRIDAPITIADHLREAK